jgi:parallel beta-helix repeat protein
VSGVVIDNNIFTNNFGGIRVDGTGPGDSTLTITNNTALNNVRNGIAILGVSSGNTLDTLTVLIDNNTANGSPSGNGVAITAETGGASFKKIIATISNNNLNDNDFNGVFVAPCGNGAGAGTNNAIDVTLINNTVKRNGSPGIFVSADNNGTCQDNTVHFEISSNAVFDNGAVNIEVSGGGGTGHDVQGSISNNTIKDDKHWPFDPTLLPPGDGLIVTGSNGTGNRLHDITISGNVVTGNDRGILVNGGTNSVNAVLDGIDIIANTVKDNGRDGILISGGTTSRSATISDVLIDGNVSTGNGSAGNAGIRVTRGTISTLPPTISLAGIMNNTAGQNSDDGILISSNIPGSGTTPISGNQANSNHINGIELRSTGYLVSNNTASSNTGCGIILGGNADGGNTAKKNGQRDICP